MGTGHKTHECWQTERFHDETTPLSVLRRRGLTQRDCRIESCELEVLHSPFRRLLNVCTALTPTLLNRYIGISGFLHTPRRSCSKKPGLVLPHR